MKVISFIELPGTSDDKSRSGRIQTRLQTPDEFSTNGMFIQAGRVDGGDLVFAKCYFEPSAEYPLFPRTDKPEI